jgi:hypothetical protein
LLSGLATPSRTKRLEVQPVRSGVKAINLQYADVVRFEASVLVEFEVGFGRGLNGGK